MSTIRVAGFGGENRAIHPKLLPDTVGTLSTNCKPGRGDLRPWKAPSSVASVPSGRQTIYRMGRDVASDSQYWLTWPTVVHAVRGLLADDTTERTYYTGDGAPKVTDNTIALASLPYPTASRPMGLPAPATAPTASAGSGTGTSETVYYLYTYVNDWGWESAPSPPSLQLTAPSDATNTITSFAAVPAGNYQVNRIRVYRTQTGSTGTEFFFLREIAYGTVSTTDDKRDLGEVLPTTTWLAPPDNLSYLTAMWNGMLAAISDGAVRFCEAYVPYAWPIAYDVIPPDSKPVALGVVGQSLLVLTTGKPVVVGGSSPDSLDTQPLEISQACVAPRSVASTGTGVAWASEDGLCWYGAGGARILTQGVMTREDWQALLPSSIIGCAYEGLYLGSYDNGSGRKGFFVDPNGAQGIYFLSTGYSAMHFDKLRDQLYVLDANGSVQKWDAGSAMTATFKSKEFRQQQPVCFSCAQVIADAYPLTVKVYADGALKHTQTVTSADAFRLPGGFLAQTWQVEITTTAAVQGVTLANSMSEL